MQKSKSNSISQNIKKIRLLNKLTQEELASKLELDTQYYAQLERGERNFTIDKIIQVCTVLKVNIQDIIVIDFDTEEQTCEMAEKISSKLPSLSVLQLQLVEKFLTEIIPFVK